MVPPPSRIRACLYGGRSGGITENVPLRAPKGPEPSVVHSCVRGSNTLREFHCVSSTDWPKGAHIWPEPSKKIVPSGSRCRRANNGREVFACGPNSLHLCL